MMELYVRLVKSPKLYFCDTGLACALLGLYSIDELALSIYRGPLFENMIFLEKLKEVYAQGKVPEIWFWTETSTNEVDFIFQEKGITYAVEAKSSATINSSWFKSMSTFTKLASIDEKHRVVVYAGDENLTTTNGKVISWKSWCSTNTTEVS